MYTSHVDLASVLQEFQSSTSSNWLKPRLFPLISPHSISLAVLLEPHSCHKCNKFHLFKLSAQGLCLIYDLSHSTLLDCCLASRL